MIRLLRYLLPVVLLLPAAAEDAPFTGDAFHPFRISNPKFQISNSPAAGNASADDPASTARPSTRGSTARDPAKAHAKPSASEQITAALEPYRSYLIPGLCALGVLVLIIAVLAWRRSRASHRLPEFAVESRLGGGHGAGVGGIISFADPTVPPSAQRQLLKDSFNHP